jgi:hypothetical protein
MSSPPAATVADVFKPSNLNYPTTSYPTYFSPMPTTKRQSPCERADQWRESASNLLNNAKGSIVYLSQSFQKMFQGGGGGISQNNNMSFVYRPEDNMKRSRTMKGGNIASHAAPISGIRSAAPHQWTGGNRSKRRRGRRTRGRRTRRAY